MNQSININKVAMLPEEIEASKKKTLSLAVTEGSAWAVMWGFGESFIAPFAIMLHAGNLAMSLLSTLPIILGALAQMAGASIIERLKHRRALATIATMAQAIGYLFLFWTPFFFPSIAIPAAVGIATLLIVCNHIGAPAWNSMMGDLVPEETRGRYFGNRTSILTIIIVLSTIAAGRILASCESHDNIWLGFGILFSIAMISRAGSAIMIGNYYDPPFNPSKEGYFSFWDFIKRTPSSNFAKFTFAITLMNGATTISAPFFSVYMIRDLHWTMYQYAITQTVMLLSQYVFLRWWGIVGDRHGNRAIIAATSILLPLLPILWAFSKNYYLLLLVQVVGGAVWSGFNLASINFMFDAVTPEKRHRAFSYYSVINGICVIIGGSVVGAFLAEHLPADFKFAAFRFTFASSLPLVFIVSGLVRIIIIIIFLPLFKEVRKIEPISSRELLWRMAIGEPIIHQATYLFRFVSSPFKNTNISGTRKRKSDVPPEKPLS